MPVDILIYALVAAGLVLWLRSILGTRHGDERQRPNPFASPPPEKTPRTKEEAPSPASASVPALGLGGPATGEDLRAGLERSMILAASAEPGIRDIMKADRSFTLPAFFKGAQDAFVMIVEAFAAGDRETLHGLLDDVVYGAFTNVIADREKKGERATVEIHAVRRMEITHARADGRTGYIAVRITADETNFVRDGADKLVHGNPDRINETIDIWTFRRDLRAREPGWFLCETRDENAPQPGSGQTVPDSQ